MPARSPSAATVATAFVLVTFVSVGTLGLVAFVAAPALFAAAHDRARNAMHQRGHQLIQEAPPALRAQQAGQRLQFALQADALQVDHPAASCGAKAVYSGQRAGQGVGHFHGSSVQQ